MTLEKYKRSGRKTKKGVAVIEFLIVAILLFALIDGITYFGSLFYRYNILSDAVTSTVRAISVNVNLAGDNPGHNVTPLTYISYDSFVGKQITNYIRQRYTSNTSQLVIDPGDVSICRDASTGLCRLRVKATWNVSCVFCSILKLKQAAVIQVDSGFEDPCFLSTTLAEPSRGCAGAGAC